MRAQMALETQNINETNEIPTPKSKFTEISDVNQEKLVINSRKFQHRSYSTDELESLRFVGLKEQQRKWKQVYQSLESDVAKDYDGLRVPNNQNKKQQKKKKKEKSVLEACHMDLDNHVQMGDIGLEVNSLQEHVVSALDMGREGDAQSNGGLETKDVGRIENQNSKGLSYSRSEMEVLRFVDVEEQERWWKEVYDKLSPYIVEEFDLLWAPNNQKQQQPQNASSKQSAGKKMDPSQCLSDVSALKTTKGPNVLNVCGDTLHENGNGMYIEESVDEYENTIDEHNSSSDEYDSIQRPAFFVEGEPDFESGPPEDGWEYLRRVRWESAHIPKVKVVKLNSSKLTSEQTAYMPSIPEITKCPQNLLPLKDWENVFLADFSELRQEISVLESSYNELDKPTPTKQSYSLQQLKKSTPTLTTILGMDAISRAATLRNSISSLETADVLSRDDCLWLFALCAAVDTPLHADTCASLRCLLRKCSSLMALKSEPDEEVAMWSILVTIAGKYFGQLDTSYKNENP
ncbi:uncharacterized protein LOC109824636 isoform X2 [Asparagus officinalis]|uniref:uncharacterized protein LOC109824636 isoform X2 n=1 Tax=Asparagus officinalis TaxID=4686 RepID=UPI00098E27B9|nr:uncharacterized protein LOC109824636 isoform X2 [Asparagus officinalis]